MSQKTRSGTSVSERNGRAGVMAYLLFEDLLGTVEWLERAFGFVEAKEKRVAGPDGRVGHTEMQVGDGTVLAGHPGPAYENPKHCGTRHSLMYVYVDDVDAHHDRAVAAGAEIDGQLEDAFYGDRRYSAVDPEGFQWTFAEAKS